MGNDHIYRPHAVSDEGWAELADRWRDNQIAKELEESERDFALLQKIIDRSGEVESGVEGHAVNPAVVAERVASAPSHVTCDGRPALNTVLPLRSGAERGQAGVEPCLSSPPLSDAKLWENVLKGIK